MIIKLEDRQENDHHVRTDCLVYLILHNPKRKEGKKKKTVQISSKMLVTYHKCVRSQNLPFEEEEKLRQHSKITEEAYHNLCMIWTTNLNNVYC